MSLRALAVSTLICAALVVAARAIYGLTWQSALVLAPVFVLSVGGVAFLVILWGKVIWESVSGRARRAPE